MIWALVEAISVVMTAATVYATGLILTYPDVYASEEGSTGELVGVSAILGLVTAIPLLLHAGMELYLRYRD